MIRACLPLLLMGAVQAAGLNDGYGELVKVPAGPFKMGDNFGDGEARERPVHTVDLDAFYIGKNEVTNGEWRRFRDDSGYNDPKFWPGQRPVPLDQIPYWKDARKPWRRHARQRPLSRAGSQLGFRRRLLQVA